MASRIIVRIEITESAKENLERATESKGMTQVAMLSRVVDWFSTQPDLIRSGVLGQVPSNIAGDVATLIMRNMESNPRKPAAAAKSASKKKS